MFFSMGWGRAVVSRLMSMGVISAGWYSVLTGLAMLAAAYLVGSGAPDDAAAFPVSAVLAVAGVWQLERGLRAEFQGRPRSTDDSE